MKRVFLWMIAAFVAIILVVGFLAAFVGSIGIGFAGAIKECGISLLANSGAQQPASSPTVTPEATPDPSATSAAFGNTAKEFFGKFSASQQAEMKKNAALIVSIGSNRPEKLSRHDIEAAVGIAIQESKITNLLVAEDHDSLGIYQQRPSAITWGTAQQIVDPVHAINKFYDHLVKIPADKRQSMTLIDIGIAVQIPDPDMYRRDWKWDQVAKEIVTTYITGGPDSSGSICSEAAGVSSGEWQLPLSKKSFCITDAFGSRKHPITGVWKLHSGVDLACNDGDPIYAVHDGTVTMAGPNGDLGTYVAIDHGDGSSSGYGHMARLADGIADGNTVKAGQVIGYVGTTGGSTGPHLHFITKIKGELTEPVAFMKEHGVTIE